MYCVIRVSVSEEIYSSQSIVWLVFNQSNVKQTKERKKERKKDILFLFILKISMNSEDNSSILTGSS